MVRKRRRGDVEVEKAWCFYCDRRARGGAGPEQDLCFASRLCQSLNQTGSRQLAARQPIPGLTRPPRLPPLPPSEFADELTLIQHQKNKHWKVRMRACGATWEGQRPQATAPAPAAAAPTPPPPQDPRTLAPSSVPPRPRFCNQPLTAAPQCEECHRKLNSAKALGIHVFQVRAASPSGRSPLQKATPPWPPAQPRPSAPRAPANRAPHRTPPHPGTQSPPAQGARGQARARQP